MDIELDTLMNESISAGYLAAGMPSALVAKKTGIAAVTHDRVGRIYRAGRSMPWSGDEDAVLRALLGRVDEEEIADRLGRTLTSVHLRWKRDLRIPAPSKTPGTLTGLKVSDMLGIEIHKLCYLIDHGQMPGRCMPGGRSIRLVEYSDLVRWCVNPENWPHFKFERVQDEHIRRLIELRRVRWNDDWWTARQVADYHHINIRDVPRYIKIGRLSGVQIMNYDGRRDTSEPQAWALWFVRRSDAQTLKIVRGKGSGMTSGMHKGAVSARAKDFIGLARGAGLPYKAIGCMTHMSERKVMSIIYLREKRGELTQFIDWHDVAGRFPCIGRAVVRYIAGWPLSIDQVSLLRSVLLGWGAHYRVTLPGTRMPRMSVDVLHEMEALFNTAGVYPFGNVSKII